MTQPTLMAQLVELQEENARLREELEKHLPGCPYPCGWQNLYSIIVQNGAFLVRSVDVDLIPEQQWLAIVNMVDYAKTLCSYGMNAARKEQK